MRVESSRVMADSIALRTSAIDAAVRDAIASGTKQLVILGAGYDGRAWRMPELRRVKVFEVDHPATQRDKQAHLSELRPAIGDVTFISMNFEEESLSAVLARSGHDRTIPTCWIWEGVVMYLTADAMRSTLVDVASRSAPASTLIVNYHTQRRRGFAALIFRIIGEPQISAWTPDEMATELHSAGFEVAEDSGMLDWNKKFAKGEAKAARMSYMRIAVAHT
jgi:methyltransferase (TIGR00027 family)